MARTYPGTTGQQHRFNPVNMTGAMSAGAWVRRNTATTWDVICGGTTNTTTTGAWFLEISDLDVLTLEITGQVDRTGQTGITNTDWQFLAVDRAAGTTTPRFHRWTNSGGWNHTNGGGTQGNPSSQAAGHFRIGEYTSGTTDNMDGDIEVVVVYSKQLTDAQWESAAFSLHGLLAQGPAELFLLRQQDTATVLRGLVAATAQVATASTTVTTNSCPYFYAGGSPRYRRKPAVAAGGVTVKKLAILGVG